MVVAQYVIYLFVGVLFFIFVAAYFSAAAGFGTMALVLLFLPLLLGGYATGLSLFFPRISAVAGMILVLPFFVSGVYSIFAENYDVFSSSYVIAPASLVILISVFAMLWSKPSVWSRQEVLFNKVLIGIFAAVPALLATYMIIGTLINLFR